MFDTIEELEKSVEEFQNNINNSNELVTNVKSVIAVLKEHSQLTSDTISQLNLISSSLPENIKENIQQVIEKTISKLTQNESDLLTELSKINSNLINDVKTISDENNQNITKLIEQSHNYNESNQSKCLEIISSLEKLQLETLITTIHENESNNKKRFLFTIIGIMVAILLGIIGLFL